MGKDRPPTIDEVLSCLFEEAYQAQEGFEYWADSCGYDRDSRKAFETYQVIQKQTDSLVHLLGENFCEVRSAVS